MKIKTKCHQFDPVKWFVEATRLMELEWKQSRIDMKPKKKKKPKY